MLLLCLSDASLFPQELDGFFDQFSSYQIAMDLLFKEQRYQDVLNIFNSMQQKHLYGTKYPRECVVLALGACYKLVSASSFSFDEIWLNFAGTKI